MNEKARIIHVDFDRRQHEIVLDCVLTFRGYAASASEFQEHVMADLAECMNKYSERSVEVTNIELGRVRQGTPTRSGKSIAKD